MKAIVLTWASRLIASGVAVWRKAPLFFSLLSILLCVSSCNDPYPSPAVVATPLPAITTEGTSQTVTADATQLPAGADRQLVVWIPTFFQSALDPVNNSVLATVYEQFERNHPGVHIEVQIRADSGEAGMLSYLRSAQRVAPAILPDIILIDTQQLWQVADLEILLPIARQQAGSDRQFYPFAIDAATSNDQLLGIPYTTNLIHLAYDPAQVSAPPRLWEEFLASEQSFVFAAGKSELLSEFSYLQYLGAGGATSIADALDSDVLLAYFSFLAEARALGRIPETVLDIATIDAAWDAMVMPDRGMAETSTHVVLQHWEMVNSGTIQYAPLFTRQGVELSVARVWAFAVVASDTEQQELSLTLISAFLDPAIQSQWSRLAMQIPTQPAAFELWRNPSPYYDFLQNELAATQSLPYGRRYAELSRRLQNAQESVLRNEMTPEEALLYLQTTP